MEVDHLELSQSYAYIRVFLYTYIVSLRLRSLRCCGGRSHHTDASLERNRYFTATSYRPPFGPSEEYQS